MLAYRHAFHAGNHADVLKHVVLLQLLRHLALKDKGFRIVDTHAGAGVYALDSPQALKKGEYLQGIARLWARTTLPAPVADYLQQVRALNPRRHACDSYPGSPLLARAAAAAAGPAAAVRAAPRRPPGAAARLLAAAPASSCARPTASRR